GSTRDGYPPHHTSRGDRADRYVAAAVAGETRKIRQARPGTRNQTLFCASVALGQLVAGGAMSESDASALLIEACATHAANGFTRGEAEATIASGLATGASEPRTTPTHQKEGHTR
ncbi:MAG: hypothetical protein ACRCYU_18270, partial [Nocardioides sp.]